MKKLICTVLLFLVASVSLVFAGDRKISYISQRRGYYEIHYEGNSSVESVSTSKGKLAGYSDCYYILYKRGYYTVISSEGRKISDLSDTKIGTIFSLTNNTIVSEKDGWIIEWSLQGRKMSERRKR